MSYEFYKVLHFVGVFLVLMSLSALIFGAWTSGGKNFPNRKMFSALHGVGLLIALVAGFGLLAKMGMFAELPMWAYGKLLIWLLLGLSPVFIYRAPRKGALWWWGVWLLAVVGAYLARTKIGS